MLRIYFYYKAVGRLTDCGLPPLLARSIVKSREHVSAIHLALSRAEIVMPSRPAALTSAMLMLYTPRLLGPHLCGTLESSLIPTL